MLKLHAKAERISILGGNLQNHRLPVLDSLENGRNFEIRLQNAISPLTDKLKAHHYLDIR
jgi:hypothetical protein